MTAVLFVVAAAGGAVARHLVAQTMCTWQALLLVNTAGAALLGWLVAHDVAEATATVVGVGLCGALTTFSSFALVTRGLGWRYGTGYVAATLACVVGAASIATAI